MTGKWKLVLDEDAVNFLLTRRKTERGRFITFMEKLREQPSMTGDFIETDDVGRPLQVKRLSQFLTTYWADHGNKGSESRFHRRYLM